MILYTHRFETPCGEMLAAVNAEGALTYLNFRDDDTGAAMLFPNDQVREDAERCASVVAQLNAYFCGERREFELPLAASGTPFQHQVWEALQRIPYGTTLSYGQLAAQLGNANASRAVGRANATNPIAVVVPCHRVIGSGGKLTGYAGGLTRKETLLQLEQQRRAG